MLQYPDPLPPNDARLDPDAVVLFIASKADMATCDTSTSCQADDATTLLPVVSEATTRHHEPRFPTGAMIDAKNTLPSLVGTDKNPSTQANVDIVSSSVDARDGITVVAKAVATEPSDLSYAELEPISSSVQSGYLVPPVKKPWRPRYTTLLLVLLFLTIVVVTGMGAYFGTSYGKVAVVANVFIMTALVNALTFTNAPTILVEQVATGTDSAPKVKVINAPTAKTTPLEGDHTDILTIATAAPSAHPSIVRTPVLTLYVNSITLSNQFISPDGTLPESRALAWMIANDTTLDTATLTSLDSDALSRSTIGFRIRQRYPLLTMWFQQDVLGTWAVGDWLVDSNECNWFGISCDNRVDTITGENQNVVTRISFNAASSYVGVIPCDIGLLSNLQHFEIQNTWDSHVFTKSPKNLQGTLPATIGRWTALTHFDVSSNDLHGTLPDSIGEWTALTHFDVSINDLDGTLPNSIGEWTALTFFDDSDNYGMTGTLPDSIGQWTALASFDISNNYGLKGTLPDGIGLWTALTSFDVSGNYGLSGTLPDSIGQWTALTHFDVRFNRLIGALPDGIGQWTALTSFYTSSNDLTGAIPSSIGNWSLIHYADFSGNSFLGSPPNAICRHIDPHADFLLVNCGVNCICCTEYCA